MRSQPGNQEPLIGALLRVPSEAIRRRIHRELARRGHRIRLAHLSVLQHPGPHGSRPGELARRAGVTKQAMNELLGELERGGYIERRPDESDGRARIVHLTLEGEDLVAAIRDIVGDVEREWAKHLGEGRFAELRRNLLDLADLCER